MDILTLAAISLITAAMCVVLRRQKAEFALLLSVAAGAIILILLINASSPIVSKIQELIDAVGTNNEYATVLIKSLGICYITSFASDCCKDSGETSLANRIEFGGKIAVVLLALPLIEEVLSISLKLIEGQ